MRKKQIGDRLVSCMRMVVKMHGHNTSELKSYFTDVEWGAAIKAIRYDGSRFIERSFPYYEDREAKLIEWFRSLPYTPSTRPAFTVSTPVDN